MIFFASASSSASVVPGAEITRSRVPLSAERPLPAFTAQAWSPIPFTVTTFVPFEAAFFEAANSAAVTGEPNVIVVGTTSVVLYVQASFVPVFDFVVFGVTLLTVCFSFEATSDFEGQVFGTGVEPAAAGAAATSATIASARRM